MSFVCSESLAVYLLSYHYRGLSVCLPACVSVYSVYLYGHIPLSVCLAVCLFAVYACLSASLSVQLSLLFHWSSSLHCIVSIVISQPFPPIHRFSPSSRLCSFLIPVFQISPLIPVTRSSALPSFLASVPPIIASMPPIAPVPHCRVASFPLTASSPRDSHSIAS